MQEYQYSQSTAARLDDAASSHPPTQAVVSAPLVLDIRQRTIAGLDMSPLLNGEMALLRFLGGSPFTWHSSRRLAAHVYHRDDAAALQLVWKYISTLRKKLASGAPELIALSRGQGYTCRAPVLVVGDSVKENER